MFRNSALALLVLCLSACATAPRPASDGQTRPPFPTAETRAAFGLAHVDVETTGLDPAYHEMIDAGVIYTDLDGRELGRLHVRILPTHPERISEGARAVNGFDVDYWKAKGAVSEDEAVRQLLEFHRRVGAGRTIIFTAWNAQFDTRFMTALLAEHGASFRDLFHYHVLDIPSMAWGQDIEDLTGRAVGPRYGVAPETAVPQEHIGMTGAEFNVAVYREIVARRAAASSR
jgi:oligoribonuclease (3'-5' exoribonuclease)